MRCDSPDAKAKLDRIQIKWMRNQNKRWCPSQSKRCLVADDVIKLFHNCAKFYGIYTMNMVIVLERVLIFLTIWNSEQKVTRQVLDVSYSLADLTITTKSKWYKIQKGSCCLAQNSSSFCAASCQL